MTPHSETDLGQTLEPGMLVRRLAKREVGQAVLWAKRSQSLVHLESEGQKNVLVSPT